MTERQLFWRKVFLLAAFVAGLALLTAALEKGWLR